MKDGPTQYIGRGLPATIFLIMFSLTVSAQRNWLSTSASESQLSGYLSTIENWRQQTLQRVTNTIEALPADVKRKLITNAEIADTFNWPNLPATIFLQFGENGNRTHYQDIRGQRRAILSQLIAGELVERRNRFLPQIINGIWAISEESTWAYPAHLSLQHHYTSLPFPGENIVDLGAGSTAAMMSWIYFLMKDSLAKVSPVIPERIRFELESRILEPFLKRDDFWWMGFQGQQVNNWNPFVNGKVLLTDLLICDDPEELARIAHKSMESVDFFINQYPDDGGCDEGPSYWSMAGGALIMYLQLLDQATYGKVNITHHSLIKEMGNYIYKLNIGGHEFVDFADAHPHTSPNVPAVFAYGNAFHSDTLKRFAAYFADDDGGIDRRLTSAGSNLESFMDYLNIYASLKATTPAQPLIKEAWLPNLQVLTVRSQGGSTDGLFLAAKGGNNAESHNHNDVGNFLIYMNGKPVIVDIGVGTYTRQTFSRDRYKIFTMQSAWHNLPTINGVMQQAGKKFRADGVRLTSTRQGTQLSMNIAEAYPKEAGVTQWSRTLTFNGRQIKLREDYVLKMRKDTTSLSLITPIQPQVKRGIIILGNAQNHEGLEITFDPKVFKVLIEPKALEDPSLQHSWPEGLTRIRLIQQSTRLSGSYELIFRPL